AETHDFSGAELEQAVVAALFTAFAAERELDDELLLGEIHSTRPLAQTMAENVESLRTWAAGRVRSANA
ncbi:MAG: ATPase, partial [Thermoanaerobaculia bacterium]